MSFWLKVRANGILLVIDFNEVIMVNSTKKHTKIIPVSAGVYLFKAADSTILYIGKATSLRARINSYFRKTHDWKIAALTQDYADIDYILTKTETDAALLEAKLIRKHQPKYNILLRDGQPFIYLMITKEPLPQLKYVRNKQEKGTYFGPFLQKTQARKAHRFLAETFRLNLCNKKIENGCLDFHIGLCAGNCKSNFNKEDYIFRINLAQQALKSNHKKFIKSIEHKIKEYTDAFEFEKAKHMHEYIENLDSIFATIRTHFSEYRYKEQVFLTTTQNPVEQKQSHNAGQQLQILLETDNPILTIDCFDISHFQSRYIVGSCVRFTNGIPDKNMFRRFNIKTLDEQNDYAALQEIVTRRYAKDPLPDLILIDGGKGQLSSVKSVLPNAHIVSLAKKEELLFADQFPHGLPLDIKTDFGKLLIALRDYAHHFAISHHRNRRSKELKT